MKWNRFEIARFVRMYSSTDDFDLARSFGCSLSEIREKARHFALAKNKARFRGLAMPRWTRAQTNKLVKLYPTTENCELARQIGRSHRSVVSKAHQLGLRKSPEYLTRMGRQNIAGRYAR